MITIWEFDQNAEKKLIEKLSFHGHYQKITACLDLPTLELFATSSLDGRIKFWNVDTGVSLPALEDPVNKGANSKRNKGIRGMDYSEDQGGNMVSWGYSTHISLWNPNNSLNRPYVGKYEGHNGIISCAHILNHGPSCVSIDDKNLVRIWDIRNFNTVQVLGVDQFSSQIGTMCILPDDNFVLGAKRLYSFTNNEAKKKNKFLDEAMPIYAEFNYHFKNFVVVTKTDIRIYDSTDGKITKVFTDLLPSNKRYNPEINRVAMGGRARKIYVGDNAGNTGLYNMKNCEFLKHVNKLEQETKEIKKFGEITFSDLKNKEDHDVTSILFIPDEKMLVIGTVDSIIKIYDESDFEESSIPRIFIGGHKETEISA